MSTKASKKGSKKIASKSSKKAAIKASNNAPVRWFAGYPATVVFGEPGGKKPNEKGKKALEQLLWGDYVGVRGPKKDGWVRVCTRHVREGWVRKSEIRKDRVLEVIFVDIGQGDGSLVVTPETSIFL